MAVENQRNSVAPQGIVVQGIEMRIGGVVNPERGDVECAADFSGCRILEHLVFRLAQIEIVDGFFEIREMRRGNCYAVPHQARGLQLFPRRNQV